MHHAEVIAHRVGEPFGTLVLALAVTVIETALIVSVMLSAPAEKAGLARDTVFAAVMIVCNGIVGLCLLLGGARHGEQGFQIQGASAALAVLVALASLALVIPNYVARELGPVYSPAQLVFAGLCRWCFTARSSLSRPGGIATTFSRSKPPMRRHTRRRPPTEPPF